MKKIIYLLLIIFLSSCFKEELPVEPHAAGSVITSTVNMDPLYKWQVYFDLGTNSIVSFNSKSAWDLGFNCEENGYEIILNGSKGMFVWNTGITDWNFVTDTMGFAANKTMDNPNGNLNTTAIGDWRISQNVYIVDRGYNDIGTHQGFRKLMILDYGTQDFEIRFSNLDGTNDVSIIVPKDTAFNFTFFSLAGTGSLVSVEPPKRDWDICFTQYLEAIPTPYVVTGCLLNRFQTEAARDSINLFSAITYDDLPSYFFYEEINTIGYDWKWYDFGGGVYIVDPLKNYIVRDQNSIYYKIHFIDFYDQNGNKGNPKFEFQEL